MQQGEKFMNEFSNTLNEKDFYIEVSTDKLCEKAVQIKKLCNDMSMRIEVINNCVCSLQNYWCSESSQTIKSFYEEDNNDIISAMKMLSIQTDHLQEIINQYNYAERINENEANSLEQNVID